METLIGWRKLSAWGLIFGLCAVVTIRAVWAGQVADIPAGVQNVLIWVTSAFFVLNVIGEHTGTSPALAMKQAAGAAKAEPPAAGQ